MIDIIPDYKNKKIEFRLKNTTPFMLKAIRTALFEIGAENTQMMKRFIYAPPKTGRIYRYKNRWHQASAPGQSPANRSGFLARSISYHVRDYHEVELYSTAKYADALEYGTKDGRIKPRPYFIRTVKKKERDNYRSLQRWVYDRIK